MLFSIFLMLFPSMQCNAMQWIYKEKTPETMNHLHKKIMSEDNMDLKSIVDILYLLGDGKICRLI